MAIQMKVCELSGAAFIGSDEYDSKVYGIN
jgi:hypothetical protein